MSIIYALISSWGFAFANILARKTSNNVGVLNSIFFRSLVVASLSFGLWIAFGTAKFSLADAIFPLFVSFIGYIGVIFLFKAFSIGKIGLVNPIINTNSLFTILIAIIFLGETLTWFRILSIFITLTGIIVISLNLKELRNSDLFQLESGILFALLTAVLFGIAFSFWQEVTLITGVLGATMVIETGNTIFSGVQIFFKKITKPQVKLNFSNLKKSWLWIFLSGIAVLFGTGFRALSFNTGEVTQVSVVAATNIIFTIFLARIFYQEKLMLKQYFGVLITFVGIVLLALS